MFASKLGWAIRSATPHPDVSAKKRPLIPRWLWVFSIVTILALSLTVFQWFRGGFPFSLFPSAAEGTQGSSAALTLGEADKLAFLNGSNIWISNLDGSGLQRLTTDGAEKAHLHWSPEGDSVIYTSGNCLNMVKLESKQVRSLTCFTGSAINSFDISPNGQNAALGLGESDLYLLPYSQLFHLRQASSPGDLLTLAQCSYYAPYRLQDTLKAINWSLTNGQMALLVSKLEDGVNRDEINVLDFSRCSPSPQVVKEILPSYFLFTLRGYFERPELSGISWNENNQLLMTGAQGQSGFGDLELYDLSQNKSQSIAPNGKCCYRDAFWSPDGSYLLYTFQPEDGGDVSLYYAPVDQLGKPGAQMTSLSLPAEFLSGSLESLQPALRTAH
jgi:WD40 repeat protein